jgi:hypothetical protein
MTWHHHQLEEFQDQLRYVMIAIMIYPNGKIIIDDPLSKQDRKGRWHCSDCQETERRRSMLKIYGPTINEKTRLIR